MDIKEPSNNGFTIYSKSGCINCIKFKNLLKDKNILYNEINCDEYIIENKENFLLFIFNKSKKEYKMFPIIFLNGEFIGGYNEAKKNIEIKENKDNAFNDNSVFN